MFEHFDIDLTKASFEWDEEKDRINFMSMASISGLPLKSFWIRIR